MIYHNITSHQKQAALTSEAIITHFFKAIHRFEIVDSCPLTGPLLVHGRNTLLSRPCVAWPGTLSSIPYTLHPTPYILYPAAYTLYHIPYTLRPTAYTLQPIPYTLQPMPYTTHTHTQYCLPPRLMHARMCAGKNHESRFLGFDAALQVSLYIVQYNFSII